MPVNRSKQGGKLYLVMMIVVIAVSLLLGFLPKIFPHFALPDAGEPGDISMSEAVYFLPVLIFLIIDRFEPFRGMKLRPIGPVSILWTLLFTVLMMPVTVLLIRNRPKNKTNGLFFSWLAWIRRTVCQPWIGREG